MNHIKRMLSMLLAVVMVFGLLVAVPTTAKAASDDPIYVLAGGDFQAGDNDQEDHYYSRINMGNILDKIKETYSTMDGFLFVGDYDGDTHNDSNANAGVAAMMEEVTERFSTLNHDNSVLIEGNHETGAVTGIDPTGGYEFDGYAVYAINETDYCERQEGKSAQIQTVADNLETWLNNKLGEGYDAPIFVITHVPLAYGTRTYTNGDGLYAKYVFDVLNTAADNGLNIIFLHGHDHAYGADNYLGGEAIYLPVGDKINIAEPGNKSKWTEETLNFTYMNAGYVGYYNENYYNVNSYEAEKLTMTVFKIENNQVTVERISKDGTYNLKSAGREGFYANSSTCSAIGLSYNTTVYASPQTITLQTNNNETAGTIGNWVGIEAETPDDDVTAKGNDWVEIVAPQAGDVGTDDVTTSNKGWVELIAPVTGGTSYSSEEVTVYKKVTNPESSKQYLIVNSANGTGYGLDGDTTGYATTKFEGGNGYYSSWNGTPDNSTALSSTDVYLTTSGAYLWTADSNSFTIGYTQTSDGNILGGGTYSYTLDPSGSGDAWDLKGSQLMINLETSYRGILGGSSATDDFYLTNSGSAWAMATSGAANVYFYEPVTIYKVTTETVDPSNGTYGKIVGGLSYEATRGMTADEAMALVKAGIDGYYYDAMSTPGASVEGTKVEDSALTWEWVDTFNGNKAGDYAIAIKYGNYLLGTAEVIVPDLADTNGTYATVVGDLTYNATAGMSAQQALDNLKEQLTGYVYEGMSAPTTATAGTEIPYADLKVEFVETYDGNTAGDYEVEISYQGKTLATAEVIVPATKTYYIAEGNGMYYVDMNTTAADALAVVKAGVTVSSATDANGTNKQTIDDSLVTWNWVDSYNGDDSGPYTVEILYNGTSLGTVEVKVNVKYETGLVEDWKYIGESEATGGTHTYTLDTDGLDKGEEHLYIIVAEDEDLALYATSTANSTAPSVDISSDGKTLTTTTRDYEYYFVDTYGFTKDGSKGLYGEDYYIRYGNRDGAYLDGVINNGNGYYTLWDNEGTYRGLTWDSDDSRFTVAEPYADQNVRLYKYTSTTGGTEAGSIYAKLEGNTVYTVEQGTSAYEALNKVKAGITGYISSSEDGSNPTELADSDLKWTWKNTYTSMVTGSYWVEISYNGVVLGTVEVQVEPAVINNYPEYPDEGAVKVNKTATGIDFQSSGIAQVEVSASGVPTKKGVDVVIMLDTSSSMTSWCVCGTQNCTATGTGHARRSAVLEESLEDLIAQFKTPGDDGQLLDIQVAIADFNGFYGDNHSSSGTAYDRDAEDMMSDDISYNANSEAQIYTGDGTLGAGAFVAAEDLADTYALNYTSGTNYDYALDAAYQMAAAKQATNAEDRDLFVIFLSDGAPMQWNYYHSQGQSSLWNSWITGAWDADDLTTSNLNCTTHSYYYDLEDHDGDGEINEHRMANAIKGDPAENYEVIRKTDGLGIATNEDNMYMVPGLGATMFSISFGAQDDGNVTAESMHHAIDSIASPQGDSSSPYHYHVTTADELSSAFASIGNEIAYAANNARFVDQMGDNFNLQMETVTYTVVDNNNTPDDPTDDTTTTKTLTPKIEIISYDIYTRQDYLNGTITEDKIGDRKGTYTVLETVTFTDDGNGNITGAYSDQIGGGTTNILAPKEETETDGWVDGVIYAKTFLYNTNILDVAVDGVNIPTGINPDGTTTGSTNVLPSETFYWKMGTVQTSELAMRYYVYLDGSMEGTKVAGSYQTNEFATLYYDNYLGNSCYKATVSPNVAWKSATVSYAFYLVNEAGQIVVNQTTGETGSFANKIAITNPVVYEEILLNNQDQIRALDVKAISDDVLPKYYTLYDDSASYTISIRSNGTGYWEIINVNNDTLAGLDGKEGTADDVADWETNDVPNLVQSTYVTNFGTRLQYSKATLNDTVGDDYTHTVVWFAVVWKPQAHPDTVVVDYGLPVDIHVLTNDMFGEKGKLAYIGSADDLDSEYDNGVYHDSQPAISSATYTGTYGTAVAYPETGVVRYTLNTMSVNGYDKFAYAVYYDASDDDYDGYYYDTVTVIPATTIYYEDSFVDVTYSSYTWVEATNDWGQYVAKDVDGDGTVDDSLWVSGSASDKLQDEDRPGKYSLTDANNIYGYDGVNKGMLTYSLGSAAKATVDYDNYAQAQFQFTGTGFDIISMTSSATGTILVDVEKYVDNAWSMVANYVVDTYYGYKQEAGDADGDGTVADGEMIWVVDPSSTDSLYQVPVIKMVDKGYGTYRVTIKATYDPVFEHVEGSKSYDFYLDAIRIYDPANDGAADGTVDTTIESAYAADGEGWPSYKELRNMIIDASSFDNVANDVMDSDMEGLVFIDGDASVGDAQIADYISYGPNNEVYLAPGQRVAFIVQDVTAPAVDEDGNPIYESDGITQKQVSIVDQVHIGLKSADGGTVTYTITNVAKAAGNSVSAGQYYNPRTFTLNTATDMYYDMTDWKGDIIVISNTGDRYGTAGILSITNIKFTYTSDPNAASEPVAAVSVMDLSTYAEAYTGEATVYMTASAAALTVDAVNTMYRAAAAEPEVDEPEADDSEVFEPETDEPEVFEPGQLDVQVSRGKIRVGDRIDVVVRTGDDVSSVTVNDRTAQKRGTDRRTGETIWTMKLTVEEVGDLEIKVVVYDAEGVAGEPVVKTVRVQQKPGFKAGGFKLPWNQD